MARANINIKEVDPKPNDEAVIREAILSFKLSPVGSDTTIDIDTLSINLTINGKTGLFRLTLDPDSTEITITQTGSTYKVEIDVDPDSSINFNSKDMITLQVDVDDTDGNSMRRFVVNYKVINLDQLEAMTDLTREFTEISINYEQGRISLDGSLCSFTWGNWISSFDPIIYRNDIPINSGYTTNTIDGVLSFSPTLSSGFNKTDIFDTSLYEPIDRINGDYKYSVFSNSQIINFMKIGLADFNAAIPSTTVFPFSSTHPLAQAAMLLGGAYYLYNAVLAGFLNQQWRVQFEEEDWKDLIGIAEKLKENTKDAFEKVKESKSKRLASPMGIVALDFAMPGGRSRYFSYNFGLGTSS